MKKIMHFLFIAIAMVGTMTISIPSARAAETKESDDSVFQKASDVINGKYEVETVPVKKVNIFQKMADGISGKERSTANDIK